MRGVFALSCISLLGLVALFALPSQAAQVHPHSSFNAGSTPGAMAIDQSAGLLYVLDTTDQVVRKFDTAGSPVGFSALGGSNVLNGSDAGSDNDQTPQNGFQVNFASTGNQIAVDNSGGASDGTIYVSDSQHGVVDVFDASGEYLTQLSGTQTPQGSFANATQPCGVATDPAGNLYVSTYGGQVDRYVPAANPLAEADYDDQIDGLPNPCQLAADSAGAVYAAPYEGGALVKYLASDFGTTSPAGTEVDPGPVNSVAVDPSNQDVYLARSSDIAQYGSSGAFEDSFGSAQLTAGVRGVAVEGSSGKVFASEAGGGEVHIFGRLTVVPDVLTGDASNVGEASATLSGTVDPNGVAVTECEFRYSYTTQGEFGPVPHPGSAPCSQNPGSGSGPVAVSADLSGLVPGQLYDFHLHAANASDGVDGEAGTFITSGTPVTQTLGVYAVDEHSAIVAGELHQAGTTYRFEWGTDETYGHSTAAAPATGGMRGVYSTELTGLQPDTTYHYRFVAASASDEAAGLDLTFHTLGGPNPAPERAYEKVTAEAKGPYHAEAGQSGTATPDGGRVVSRLIGPVPGSAQGQLGGTQVNIRTGSGWTSRLVTPDMPATDLEARATAFTPSPDLTTVAIGTPLNLTPGAGGEILGGSKTNLFIGGLGSDSFQLVTNKPDESGTVPIPLAASADFSHLVYVTRTSQAPGHPDGVRLPYEWYNGASRLVAVMPDGSPAPAAVIGSGFSPSNLSNGNAEGSAVLPNGTPVHAISEDGERIVFQTPNPNQPEEGRSQIYLREGGSKTVVVSASQRTPPDPAGTQPATFWDAEAMHGSRVLFTSCEKLTDDATADTQGPDRELDGGCARGQETFLNYTSGRDLYLYDVESGELSDLTTGDPEGADVYGVIGASRDLQRIYFLAGGALASGAIRGRPNIFLWDHGHVELVAALRPPGEPVAGQHPYDVAGLIASNLGYYRSGWSRVSADGSALLFRSRAPLAGYDNGTSGCVFSNENIPCAEAYLFDASTHSLACVSCPADGTPPSGQDVRFSAGSNLASTSSASTFTVRQDAEPTRNLSADGSRVFFETRQSLLGRDTNGRRDVYEWNRGVVRLVSPGSANADALFADASASGDDVFFTTTQRLLGSDRDGLADLYDARVDGGFPEAPPLDSGCEGDACQAPVQAPSDPTPASSTFNGVGDPKPRSRKKGHYRKRRHAKRRHAHRGRRAKGRHANQTTIGRR